ncbi:tyrosine-type recombinase/integrase [Acidisoma silvae]|uniref:Tyrosine-type recombinase/integrase n=1 Tax=Acidisoma silvae TaxID=2802396 RepID=A0A964E1Y2_9PROT|nr:tyrosine-type recombinase/integrase [Acidisoma silvae]MCB8878253.1 tyrosine-type recombinase/integrase [Acidisoma silvae]
MAKRDVAVLPPEPAQDETAIAAQQVSSDDHLISLWLHGRSAGTQRAYAADVAAFRDYVQTPLRKVSLGDLQAFHDSLADLSTASQARKLSAVKSLLTFGQKTGYLVLNVGTPVKLPKIKQALAERILDEDAVLHMLTLERHPRNKALLRLLYLGGLRISEACGLKVRDLQVSRDSGQITVFGKGGKTRVVLLKPSIWADLAMMRGNDPEAAVFRSREGGGHLNPSQVHRIVKKAAARAGLSDAVSAHWLRHAHVSHALDRGAPAHLVQATVGHASLTTTSRYAHARPTDSSSKYLAG